jgi:hypothetical protein
MNAKNDTRKMLHEATGGLNYHLELFGDALAKKQKYKNDLEGIEALRYYLMQKHHWLPRDVASLSHDDLRFALSEELAGWSVPKAKR